MATLLVTGAAGFIGSHLVEHLLTQGHRVRAFVRYNSAGSTGWLGTLPASLKTRLEVFSGDIRDPHGVYTAMEGCTEVYHLAALIGIPYSYHSPDSYVETNIRGTLNILQAARQHRVRRLLITSTSEVYGTAQYVPMDEKHPQQGQSPYSASKIGADRMAESFYRSFDLPVTLVRPFNTYGPRQSARAVIPAILTQLLHGETRIRLGDLSPVRDFVYVQDTVAAFTTIAAAENTLGRELNIATGTGISIGELAQRLLTQVNPAATLETDSSRLRPENSEVLHLCGDSSLLHSLTGWAPQYDMDQGLAQTIAWFRQPENRAHYPAPGYQL